jgi:hypothetical protein
MSTSDSEPKSTKPKSTKSNARSSRRKFLGQMSGAAVATAAVSAIGLEPLLGIEGSIAEAVEITPISDSDRSEASKDIRKAAADNEKLLGLFPHPTNGDEELYPNRIGNFHKTLPHDSLTGEVDQVAYNQMLFALSTGNFNDFEAIPRLPGAGRIANPLGGLAFDMDGPDTFAIPIGPIPPPIASAGAAAEVVELYWEAYLRDVPFTDYTTSNAIVMQACAELSSLADFQGPKIGGVVTPQSLFRYPYPGCLDGPMVSQFMYQNFTVDGIPVKPMPTSQLTVINWNANGTIKNFGSGMDWLTGFNEWLAVQNGLPNPSPTFVTTDVPRFIRSVRDLGQLAGSDNINSTYIRAANLMGVLGGVANGPYSTPNLRQSGFATVGGGGYLSSLLGNVHKGERHSWFTKWQLHRHLRPEAFGGLVDRRKRNITTYNLHPQLLNSQILPLIGAYNFRLNNIKFPGSNETAFLHPQMSRGGSPSHPSASAGHAFTAGACVTLLKYWFADANLPAGVAKQPSRDGLTLVDYTGPTLTVHGELNKLCHNLSEGRNMLGVHYRVSDNYSGNQQGEAVAIRLLREAKATYPEPAFTITFNKFDGTPETI